MENCIKMETNDSFIDLAQGIDFPSGSSYDKNKNSDFIDEKKVKDEELAEENRAKQVEAEKNKMYRPGDSLRLGNNASPSQVDALVAFLEEHQDLARGRLRTAAGRVRSKQLWARITKKLNAQGECIKSVKQWQKIWTDKKYLAKKAAAAARSANRSGTTTPNQLSLIEQRIVALLGKDYEPETEAPEPRYMTIEMHPTLQQSWIMADLARECSRIGAKTRTASNICDPNLVFWTRNSALPGIIPEEHCNRALYVLEACVVAEFVRKQLLTEKVMVVRKMTDCEVTLVLFGTKDYFKSSRRKTSNSNRDAITEIELEMAVTDLLCAGCDTSIVNTPNELALLMMQFTKAIAEEPYKKGMRECESEAEFYMKSANQDCVVLDNNGNGVSRLWQQMITMLPYSSLETSRALCSSYKSPFILQKALRASGGVSKLASIRVPLSSNPNSKDRKLGVQFAKKLHTLFTSEDGNALIE